MVDNPQDKSLFTIIDETAEEKINENKQAKKEAEEVAKRTKKK